MERIEQKPAKRGPGRPVENAPKHPQRVNWKGPITWKVIDTVAQRCTAVGKPNSRIIVQSLRAVNSIFNLLHHKTLEKWFDKEKSVNKVVWTDRAQADAQRKHKQIYSPGRAGVLVSSSKQV